MIFDEEGSSFSCAADRVRWKKAILGAETEQWFM